MTLSIGKSTTFVKLSIVFNKHLVIVVILMGFFRNNAYIKPLGFFTLFLFFLVYFQSLNGFLFTKEKWLREIDTNKNVLDIVEIELENVPPDKINDLLKKYDYLFSIQKKTDLSKNSELYFLDNKNKFISLFPHNIPQNLENHLNNIITKKFKWCFLILKNNLYIIKKIDKDYEYRYIILKINYIKREDSYFNVYFDDLIYQNSATNEFSFFNFLDLFFLYIVGCLLIFLLLNKFNRKIKRILSEENEIHQAELLKLNNEVATFSDKYYGLMESEKLCRSLIIKDSKSGIIEISKIYLMFKEFYKEEEIKDKNKQLKGFFIYDIIIGNYKDIGVIFNEVLEIYRYNLDFKGIKIQLTSKIKSHEIHNGSHKLIYSLMHLMIDTLGKESKNNNDVNVFLCKKNKEVRIVFKWNGLAETNGVVVFLKKSLDLMRIKTSVANDKIEFIFPVVVSDIKIKEGKELCSNVVKLPPRR